MRQDCAYPVGHGMRLWLLCMLLYGVLCPKIVHSELTWNGPPFFLVTRGMAVADILRDFGANYALPVIISPQVEDVFVGKLRHEAPEQLLRQLARLFNLVWYHDGEALYIYKAHEVISELIAPNYLTAEQLGRALQHSGILTEKGCRVKLVDKFNAFEVFGVPACIKRITTLAKDLDARAQTQAENQQAMRLFPLKYASASDITYHYRQQKVIVPGVVTLLKEMRRSQPLVGDGDSTPEHDPNSEGPRFSADARQNAVIVHDREIAMPMYQTLIEQLDQQQVQIEISVAIIDVNVGDLGQLGVEWSSQFKLDQNRLQLNQGHFTGERLAPPEPGTYFSALLSHPQRFMVRVQALQQHAKAKILSQPSIITLNNMQAILDKNVTFYTKLTSKESAQLGSVTSGTLLRVTPRLVEQAGSEQKQVFLQLNIQDGRPESALNSAEPLPQVQNSEITTQAILKSGQSLLLGGFVQDRELSTQHKIPLLGDIPGLGVLFRTTQQEINSVVRLFLIKATPLAPV